MKQRDNIRLTLRASALTAEAFAPFGDVIGRDAGNTAQMINYGNTECIADVARLDLQRSGGRPRLSLYRSQPQSLPLRIRLLEHHPLGSQMFMPLGDQPWLLVVAPRGPLEPGALRAFAARADQGVNYHAGTWHHFSLALHAPSDFLVLDWHGPQDNTIEATLPDSAHVSVELTSDQG